MQYILLLNNIFKTAAAAASDHRGGQQAAPTSTRLPSIIKSHSMSAHILPAKIRPLPHRHVAECRSAWRRTVPNAAIRLPGEGHSFLLGLLIVLLLRRLGLLPPAVGLGTESLVKRAKSFYLKREAKCLTMKSVPALPKIWD